MARWRVETTLEKERFALGESVPLAVSALCLGPGDAVVPDLAGGGPQGPLLVVRRDGLGLEIPTDVFELGGIEPPINLVGAGNRVQGTLELSEWIDPLVAGSYEVEVVIKEGGSRSSPVAFVVERLGATAWVAEPMDATGAGRKTVLRTEPKGGDEARLVLACPVGSSDVVLDLGPVAPEARLALSVLPAGEFHFARWAVATIGSRVQRIHVGGEPEAQAYPDVDLAHLELGDLVPLGATAGTPVAPRLPGMGPLDPARAAGPEVRWRELHLAATARDARGRPVLVGASFAPDPDVWPRVVQVPLPDAPVAGKVVALSDRERVVLLAFQTGPVAAVLAYAWTDQGLRPGSAVLQVTGAYRGFDAVRDSTGPGVPAALLVEDEREGTLVLARVRLESDEVAPPIPLLSRKLVDLPPLEDTRLRLGPRGQAFVVAARREQSAALLVDLATGQASEVAIDSVDWDLEVAERSAWVLELHPLRGLVRARVPRLTARAHS